LQVVVENLGRRFGSRWVVARAAGVFPPGVNLVLGPNGAGKSTLLAMLATVLAPSRGSIRYDGQAMSRNAWEIRRQLGYVPQTYTLPPELSCRDWLCCAAVARGLGDWGRSRALADDLLDDFGIQQNRTTPLGQAADAARDACLLAQSLLGAPALWILDEPPDCTGPDGRSRLLALINERRRDTTIVLSTHRVRELGALADRVWVLASGQVLAAGVPPDHLRSAAAGAVTVSRWPHALWATASPEWASQAGRAWVTEIVPEGDLVRVRSVGDFSAPPSVLVEGAEPTWEDGLQALLLASRGRSE